MIFVDTNAILRLIAGDVPEQARLVAERIAAAGSRELVVTEYVFAEAATVLEFSKQYLWPRVDITDGLKSILGKNQFLVSSIIAGALEVFINNPKLDFVDCLLVVASNRKSNRVLTFDKDLLKVLR